jgi:hypothetical protein
MKDSNAEFLSVQNLNIILFCDEHNIFQEKVKHFFLIHNVNNKQNEIGEAFIQKRNALEVFKIEELMMLFRCDGRLHDCRVRGSFRIQIEWDSAAHDLHYFRRPCLLQHDLKVSIAAFEEHL